MIAVSVTWGPDGGELTISGATAADLPQPLQRIVRDVAGMRLGTFNVDAANPDGVYLVEVKTRAGDVVDVTGRA